jgi:hypothetical protein
MESKKPLSDESKESKKPRVKEEKEEKKPRVKEEKEEKMPRVKEEKEEKKQSAEVLKVITPSAFFRQPAGPSTTTTKPSSSTVEKKAAPLVAIEDDVDGDFEDDTPANAVVTGNEDNEDEVKICVAFEH